MSRGSWVLRGAIVLLVGAASSPVAAQTRWVDASALACDEACARQDMAPVTSGPFTNGQPYWVCAADAGGHGFRVGFNLRPGWADACWVAYGEAATPARPYRCLCEGRGTAPPSAPSPSGVVPLQVGIPVTLAGPGLAAGALVEWRPAGALAVRVGLDGRNITVAGAPLEAVPLSMSEPVITVTLRRDGAIVVRVEQPPTGTADRGQVLVLSVRWQGRAVIADRWAGSSSQRAPAWAR